MTIMGLEVWKIALVLIAFVGVFCFIVRRHRSELSHIVLQPQKPKESILTITLTIKGEGPLFSSFPFHPSPFENIFKEMDFNSLFRKDEKQEE
jgi:hypothetical protein